MTVLSPDAAGKSKGTRLSAPLQSFLEALRFLGAAAGMLRCWDGFCAAGFFGVQMLVGFRE